MPHGCNHEVECLLLPSQNSTEAAAVCQQLPSQDLKGSYPREMGVGSEGAGGEAFLPL